MAGIEDDVPSGASPALLSIGELADRTGVAATALRYYDELTLLTPAVREAGRRRRYTESAVAEVAVIRFLSEVGFTLSEISSFLAAPEPRSRQELIVRKLTEVVELQHQLEVARELLEHGRRCHAVDPMACSRFWAIIDRWREGTPLQQSHAEADENCERS